jgi:uncharacterized membrane protein
VSIRISGRQFAALVIGYLAGVSLFPYLPEREPYLQIFQIGPGRGMVAFLLPSTALLICALLGSLWTRDPIRSHEPRLEVTYEAIVFRIVLFITSVQLVVVIGLLERAGVLPQTLRPVVSRMMPVALGVALMAIGNLLPRLKPNVVIGIRTARTLADQAAWSETNRVAGYVAVALGAVFVVAGAILPRQPAVHVMRAAAAAGVVAIAALVVHSRRQARA